MGKKKKKAVKSFVEQLAAGLLIPDGADLASLATMSELSDEDFRRNFESAKKLVEGPDPRQIVKLPASFQVAFLLVAEKEQDDDLLGDLLNLTTDKLVKKEAKRIIHRMRSSGLDVSAGEEGGSSILDRRVSTEEPELACYISPVTGQGSRMIWLARYTHGGVSVYQSEINDTDGLIEFSGGVIGRNRYRHLLKEILNSDEVSMVEISYAEARQRVAKAVTLSRETSHPLPEGYLEASGELPELDAVPLPEASEAFSAEEIEQAAGLYKDGAQLHELPEFADWLPAEEILEKIQAKFKEIESSQVSINNAQRVDQVKKSLDDAVVGLIGDEQDRARYRIRLFEMAAHLKQCAKEEAALQTVAAALQLDQEGFAPLDSPFFVRMIEKLFRSPEEIVDQMSPPESKPSKSEKKDPGKLIVTP
jgi:hypothetical protein